MRECTVSYPFFYQGEYESMYSELPPADSNSYTPYSVTLETGSWYKDHKEGERLILVTKEQLMSTLVNVK